jgi:hypothetical protein
LVSAQALIKKTKTKVIMVLPNPIRMRIDNTTAVAVVTA